MLRPMLAILMTIAASPGVRAADQKLHCVEPPPFPTEYKNSEQHKAKLEGWAKLLSKLVGDAGLEGAVESAKSTIYQSPDKILVAWQTAYLTYIFCTTLSDSKSSGPEDRQALAVFQKTLSPPPPLPNPDPTAYKAKRGEMLDHLLPRECRVLGYFLAARDVRS